MRPIIFSVFRCNTEINKYYPVIHYSKVLRLDVLVHKAACVQAFDSLNHLDKNLKETQLALDIFTVEVLINGELSIF